MNKGMRSSFDGGGFNAVTLEKLQRKFGTEPTRRVHVPDPMVGHNMRSTAGCPCDACEARLICRMTCSPFERWVARGQMQPRKRKA
jgi:hypothetical protein